MTSESINLQSDVEKLGECINQSDTRSRLSFEISDLKLAQERTKLRLEINKLHQEEERLRRLQKNSNRRPFLFWMLVIIIIILYLSFFIISTVIFLSLIGVINHTFIEPEARLYVFLLILLSIVPTVLVALVMKAIFSATAKHEEKSTEIKITDAVPIKVIAESLAR